MNRIDIIKGAAVTIVATTAEICMERFVKGELGLKGKVIPFVLVAIVGAACRKDAMVALDNFECYLKGS